MGTPLQTLISNILSPNPETAVRMLGRGALATIAALFIHVAVIGGLHWWLPRSDIFVTAVLFLPLTIVSAVCITIPYVISAMLVEKRRDKA